MRIALLLLALAPLHAFAVADFSGHWVATSGKVSSNVPGIGSDCSRVEIVIEQDASAIVTQKYQADCTLFGTHWGPIRQEIRGNQVLEEGEVVGTISDDTLMTTSQDGSAEHAYNLKLIREPSGEWILKSYYGARTAIGAMATEADLRRQ